METLQGRVIEILYRNDTSCYSAARIEQQDGSTICAFGVIPTIEIGDELTLHGTSLHHRQLGRQFQFDSYSTNETGK